MLASSLELLLFLSQTSTGRQRGLLGSLRKIRGLESLGVEPQTCPLPLGCSEKGTSLCSMQQRTHLFKDQVPLLLGR